ncbi:unnamed protein product, partial [Pylaiella littoralis]
EEDSPPPDAELDFEKEDVEDGNKDEDDSSSSSSSSASSSHNPAAAGTTASVEDHGLVGMSDKELLRLNWQEEIAARIVAQREGRTPVQLSASATQYSASLLPAASTAPSSAQKGRSSGSPRTVTYGGGRGQGGNS